MGHRYDKRARQEKGGPARGGAAHEWPQVRVRSSKRRSAVRLVRGCTVRALRVRVCVTGTVSNGH
eukprot:5311739-Prymnesium_polylepis.1